MGIAEKLVYYLLVISATKPDMETWFGEDMGHFVQKVVSELDTSFLPSGSTVEFGLGTTTYPVQLQADARLTQAQLEAGPTCARPTLRLEN